MTWMVIRLILSLAFIGVILWFAARAARKRGLGGAGNGLIEVVARQRMGRSSSVNVLRIADVVLVVGATEEQVTVLAEVDGEAVEAALRERDEARTARVGAAHRAEPGSSGEAALVPAGGLHRPGLAARTSTGALSGSVLDPSGWGSMIHQLRERTVRRT